jgi:hypothetical protein
MEFQNIYTLQELSVSGVSAYLIAALHSLGRPARYNLMPDPQKSCFFYQRPFSFISATGVAAK